MQHWSRNLTVVIVAALLLWGGLGLAAEPNALVNINTADEASLITLHHIGKSRARAIIAYRQEHGPFQSTDQLKEVDGIGQRVFEAIKARITVEKAAK